MNIKQFKKIMEQFRVLDSELQAQTILALVLVYFNENNPDGYSVGDLADDLGVSHASASRNWMVWSKLTRSRKVGPDYITAIECLHNRARKRLSLTPKGKACIESMFD
jgi:DNA-binding MarR family transcriptional regulator